MLKRFKDKIENFILSAFIRMLLIHMFKILTDKKVLMKFLKRLNRTLI